MLTQNQILNYLNNDEWFTPSMSQHRVRIIDKQGRETFVPQSYYHLYENGEQISIRVSNHGTALRTWLKRRVLPNQTKQNLSVVFANEPVSSEVKIQPTKIIDNNGKIKTQNLYFVIEQYAYKMDSLSLKDFKRIISKLKHLDDNTVFNDPFKKKPNKIARRTVLTPTDEKGNKIPNNTNPIHQRQIAVANNPDKEVDAFGNVIKDNIHHYINNVLTENYLHKLIIQTIKSSIFN